MIYYYLGKKYITPISISFVFVFVFVLSFFITKFLHYSNSRFNEIMGGYIMVCLHIDVNDHIVTLNCPSWHYAMKLIERQNWKYFDNAWLFDSKGIMFAKFILGGDKVGIHFFE